MSKSNRFVIEKFWAAVWMMPTLNILIMSIVEYVENFVVGRNNEYNWWFQFLFIVIQIILLLLHYLWSFLMPLLLYKFKNRFNTRCCLFAVTSVFMANIFMLLLELKRLGFEEFPIYMMRTIGCTIFFVMSVSMIMMIKGKQGRK